MVEHQLDRIAENSLLKLASRALLVICIPVAGWFATESYATITRVADQQIRLETLLVSGIEPRVRALENEVADIRSDVRARTTNRFDQDDADKLRQSVLREIDRINTELADLRKAVERMNRPERN
jgi:hypothetical protein